MKEIDRIAELEQERNEWKKKYEDAANENLLEIYELIKKNDAWRGIVNVVNGKLEQENTELKEAKEQLIDELSKFYREKYYIKMLKLKQTLNAIKEIAEDGTKTEDYLLGQRYTDLIDRILDLITKAEVGE